MHLGIDFWEDLGGFQKPKGIHVGTQIDQKSMPKSIKKLMHLGIDFWEDLGGFWEGKWSHVGTKFGA